MYLCSRNHEEICHEWLQCPLCEAQARIDELIRQMQEVQCLYLTAMEDLAQTEREHAQDLKRLRENG